MAQKQATNAVIYQEIGSLKSGFEILLAEFREERRIAASYRSDQRTVVSALGESVRVLAKDVEEVKPLAESWRRHRDQGRGAIKLARGLYAVLGAAITAGAGIVGYKLHAP